MHRLLERQLRRHFGNDFQPDEKLQSFLAIVDSYYHEADKEQRLLQNALAMNTVELNEVNKQLRVHNAEMTRTLLNALSDGVYATDQEGRITFMNAQAERILGWQEHELIGRDLSELAQRLRPDGSSWPAAETPQMTVILGGNPVDGSAHFMNRDERFVPVAYRARPLLQDGKIIGALVSFQDVSHLHQAQSKLSEAYDRLRETLTELEFQKYALDQHAIVSIADSTGRIIYVNDKFVEVSQYSSEELVGQDHRILNSGYHPQEFFREMWRRISRGNIWRGEVKNRSKDGHCYWVDSTIVPFMDADGKPLRYVSIRTDITARKEMDQQLQDQRAFYERISETLGEGLYVQDAKGRCSYMNSEAERLLGWARAEFIGKPVHDAIHNCTADGYPLAAADCPIQTRTREAGSMRSVDQVFVRKDGTMFPVEVSSQAIMHNGKVDGIVVAFQDISERKQAEEALRAAKEAAEEANRAKSDFLANMSHEIRTPMNGIIGMTDLALDTELNVEQKEYLSLVKSSADALLDIINDILDFSKIEAGKMDLDAIDFSLHDLLSQTARSIALRAHQKHLELLLDIDSSIPAMLVGDPGRLRQIVLNLLGNAIKFTENGEIVVKAALCAAQPDHQAARLHISVCDTGIGIPADKFKAIFESFSQADSSTTRQYGGTGLGLTISTRLVELMNGRIWVESEVGKGSTFHIEVALGRSSEPGKPFLTSEALQGLRVLVADDNASNRAMLGELLRRWKMQPTLAANADEAVLAMDRAARDGERYQLLLFDARMPAVDGFELLSRLRAPGLAPQIMMLTSDNQQADVARCREFGVSTSLLKPFSQSDLFDAIVNTLGLSMERDDRAAAKNPLKKSSRALQVLVAEDNSVNQVLALRLLARFGHAGEVAKNGLEAVRKWQAGEYDLILMDVDMPELNGYEATARIRDAEKKRGGRIPIIGLTANVMQGSREECLAAGMDGYLSKPIDVEALWAELDSFRARQDAAEPLLLTFELRRALALMDNDMDLFHEMVNIYCQEYPGYLDRLHAAISGGDREQTTYLAHTIRGMLSVFAVDEISALAEKIEQGDGSEYLPDYERLRQALGWLAAELRKK